MKNSKKLFTLIGLLMIFQRASADWSTSGGVAHFNDIHLNAVYGSVAYEYDFDRFSIMPEFRFGVGVDDREISANIGGTEFGAIYEVDNIVSFKLRGQYKVSDSFNVFIQPSIGQLNTTIFESSTEFSLGAGASYEITDRVSLELIYEAMDRSDVVSLGLRYSF